MSTPTSPHVSERPIAAVLAVVIRDDDVLLVRRANPPDAGLWGFPGGKIEPGETIPDAALRELLEETGVTAEALRVFTAVDAFELDETGGLRRHFVLIAVLCRWTSGNPVAADDALETRWVQLADLESSDLVLSRDVANVARQAADLMSEVQS